jgi:ribosome-associated translation inhibitor RaiA
MRTFSNCVLLRLAAKSNETSHLHILMILPVQITFRNMDSSSWVEDRIRDEAQKLDRYYERITSCRVMVEVPHRHHQHGQHYHIRVELGVPGTELVVTHEPSLHSAQTQGGAGEWEKHLELHPEHKDIYIAIHDAFKHARRQLQDYVRRMRGEVKLHGRIPPTRRDKLASFEEVESVEEVEGGEETV